MKDFHNYLDSKRFATKKKNLFYVLWVKKMYVFIGKDPGSDINNDDMNRFINHLIKNNKEWQVKQVEDTIKLYL